MWECKARSNPCNPCDLYDGKTVQRQLKTEKSFQTEKDKKFRKRQESDSVLLEHENKKNA
ncbi:MAG TPA: hypothetical protein DIV51_01590 [Lachnospiraceae bacterium]|nr:hypothetical protein [Lachnospiraceae bacterium]